MAKLQMAAGSTSQTVNVFVQDSSSTTGAGKTGLAFNTASLTAYYILPRAAAVAITLATQTVTGAWATGGFVEIDATNMPGWYRLDLPNSVIAAGRFVDVMLKGASGMAPCPLEIELTATNNQSTNTVTTGTAQGGSSISITLATAASSTDGIYDPGIVRIVGGTGAGQVREILDYVGSTRIAYIDRDWRVAPDSTSVYEILAATNLQSTNEGLAQGGGASTITFNASASSVDNFYNGQLVVLRAGVGQDQSGIVLSYVGATKVATMTRPWATQPTSGSVYMVWPVGQADEQSIKSNPVVNAGTVTYPTSATLASTTNLTGGTVTTVSGNVNGSVASVTGAVGSVTGNVGGNVVGSVASVTGNVGGNVTGSVGSIAANGITNASFAADTTLRSARSGTAQAGGSITITLDASASATTDFYKNSLVVITGGTGAIQGRFITAYNGSTKVATVTAWATNPDNTSTFSILPFDAIIGATAPTAAQVATAVWTDLTAGSDFSTVGSVGAQVKTNLDVAVSSRMATYTQPTGFLAATFPTGTIANTTNISTVGAVSGAVGSVTGNVGGSVASVAGNVSGSVGSVTARVTANTDQLAGQTVSAAAGVTFPSSVASPTNITAGTITTVTNLTNAPTSGDLTATMKASVTAAVPTAVQVADALLGRNVEGGSTGGRTVSEALYALRNKWTSVAGVYSVYKTDDATLAWASVLSSDALAQPLTGSDPT